MSIEQYKVEITPLEKDGVYQSTAIAVTDFVMQSGSILKQVDDGDFDIGVFVFDDVKLRLINNTGSIESSGRFWDVNSPSSIFKYKRDLAKVTITFLDKTGVETEQFSGLINDTLTKEDFDNGFVDITIMSKAGIFNKNAVLGGSVGDGMTVKEALESILDRPAITNFLNYSSSNINPALDVVIDSGSRLDNLSYKAALDKIMLMSGSVLIVDSSDNIIVKDRADNGNTKHEFFNAGDAKGLNNIIRMAGYNTGVQRAFNFYSIDKTFKKDQLLESEWGLRDKKIEVAEFITNVTTQETIIDYYLANFSTPKQEFQIQMQTEVAKAVNLLDLCTLSYAPIMINSKPNEAFSFPANTPTVLNKRYISSNIGFKVIAKQVNIGGYTTTLKLREIGTKAGDSTI